MASCEGPEVNVPSVETKELPQDWRTRVEVTRDLGTAWLKRSESVLLRVPSALVPETVNFLFNPSDSQAKKFHIKDVFSYPFEPRLKT
jgi:RES domain-containing protein